MCIIKLITIPEGYTIVSKTADTVSFDGKKEI